MSYFPLFDISTLHYTNYALQSLLHSDINSLRRYISEIQNLNLLGKDSDDIYSNLRDSVYILNGGQPDSKGRQPFEGTGFSIDYGAHSKGGEFIRLIFGILCLTKFVEAICFSEKIYYTSASPWMTVSIKNRWPTLNVLLEDADINIYDPLDGSKGLIENVYEWLKSDKLAFYGVDKSIVEKFALTCFEYQFMNLSSLLFDTSFGITSAPMTIECTPNFEVMHPGSLWNSKSEINVILDAINPSRTSLSQIGRMYFYLMKSFQYHYICDQIKADYVWNEIRGPFLWSIFSARPTNDIQRLLDLLALGIGNLVNSNKREFKDLNIRKSFIFDCSAFFRLVLSRVNNLIEIFREAKAVRNELKPLRQLLHHEGNSDTVVSSILNALDNLTKDQNDCSMDSQKFKGDGLKAYNLENNESGFYGPNFRGGLSNFNGYVSLVKAYTGAYSSADRILKLIENREQ